MLKKSPLVTGVSAFILMCLLGSALVPAALADSIHNTQGFRKRVTVDGIREHLEALDAIGEANGGTRVSGTPGFDASAEYVIERMTAAGYEVSTQEFSFSFNGDQTPPELTRVTAPSVTFVDGVDYLTMTGSGAGETTAQVYAVDLVVPSPGAMNGNTSGCEAADFAGFPAGGIALMQRGTCPFRQKALNALAAGASGVIIFNEGQAGRTAVSQSTVGAPPINAAIVSTSFAVGDNLRNGVLNGPTGITAYLRTDRIAEVRSTRNVIAETPGGDPSRVVVVGAHLDSVTRGPGIHDNGSGSATLLEIAEVFAEQERDNRNKLRFMWYGAEEFGLIGSTFYVNSLPQEERDNILLMLNFDMIGSPNYVRFVYDGNNSAFPVGPDVSAGPPGSGFIESVFADYFASQGLASAETPFNGRSDYGPFIAVGIPAGGLFTGAEGIKTASQAAIYGGDAGGAYDVCYHLACDTVGNVNFQGLDEMSDAVAHAVLFFSRFKGALPGAELEAAAADRVAAAGAPDGGGDNDTGKGVHPAHEHEGVSE